MRLIMILLFAITTVFAANIGDTEEFSLVSERSVTFTGNESNINNDEMLKVQLSPMGPRNERPTRETPVFLGIALKDYAHGWVMPWQPGGGHPQQWIEVLLCDNHHSVNLRVWTNSSIALPMRWKVSTENVRLGKRAFMKSTPADVSYRHFKWDDKSEAVELDVFAIVGENVCASLVVGSSCYTHPYQIIGSESELGRVFFARAARIIILREHAPGGFWLYLIPEANNTKCTATAARAPHTRPPPAKTIEVSTTKRFFFPNRTNPPPPLVDDQLHGDPLLAKVGGSKCAGPKLSNATHCQTLLSQCIQSCNGSETRPGGGP